MHALLHSVPPTLQQATTFPHLCWRLLGTCGVLVSCGVPASFSWVLVCTRFCLCPPSSSHVWMWELDYKESWVIAKSLFQRRKRRLYTWTSLDGQYWNQIDYILCSQRWRSSIELAKTRLGADCGSDHELLMAKFRLKLKKVGKTTRPFRYT